MIPPADLPDVPVGAATVLGWGSTTGEGGPMSNTLQSATTTVQSKASCERRDSKYDAATELCGYDGGKTAICGGDSGGPLLRDGRLIGINSKSWLGCNTVSFYTNVGAYRAWIKEKTGV
ncbi:trypsin-like serine protease [Streptomyces sp. NPDC048330]|uniref:trypsin-like serine protease n=1 Tax=Streptomyces sp. NPDC048330 TaxID=3365533 RepID=UPI00371E73B7